MKLNIPRVFEKSKILSTEVGAQISEFVDFMADFVEQTTRALRNQVTIGDNMDAIISEVTIPHQTETVVYTNNKTPIGIHVIKVSSKDYGVDSLRWYIDEKNQTKVWIKYDAVPISDINVKLVIYFS